MLCVNAKMVTSVLCALDRQSVVNMLVLLWAWTQKFDQVPSSVQILGRSTATAFRSATPAKSTAQMASMVAKSLEGRASLKSRAA